ncbi:MAG TPA: hypothetical protein PLP33_27090 [Leptospiraceae bacterium]|nr:hypothetical protein [Leptospiraceae bacterium]
MIKKKDINKILEKFDGIIITGQRGSGKTKAGMKVLKHLAEKYPLSRGLIITPTIRDSHILAEKFKEQLNADFKPAYKTLELLNGFRIFLTGTEQPDYIHGHQQGIAWLEEVPSPDRMLSELIILGLRIKPAKLIITTSEPQKVLENEYFSKSNLYTYYVNQDVEWAWELNRRMRSIAA